VSSDPVSSVAPPASDPASRLAAAVIERLDGSADQRLAAFVRSYAKRARAGQSGEISVPALAALVS